MFANESRYAPEPVGTGKLLASTIISGAVFTAIVYKVGCLLLSAMLAIGLVGCGKGSPGGIIPPPPPPDHDELLIAPGYPQPAFGSVLKYGTDVVLDVQYANSHDNNGGEIGVEARPLKNGQEIAGAAWIGRGIAPLTTGTVRVSFTVNDWYSGDRLVSDGVLLEMRRKTGGGPIFSAYVPGKLTWVK